MFLFSVILWKIRVATVSGFRRFFWLSIKLFIHLSSIDSGPFQYSL